MTEECKRQHKWIGGCRFEPRYDVSEPIIPANLRKANSVEEFRRKTYVGEVCTRCGRFVALPKTSSDAKVGADSHG